MNSRETSSDHHETTEQPETDDGQRRELNPKAEADRLKTFETWSVRFMDHRKLAAAGFIYTGRGDTVKCVFCAVEIGRWEQGDDPLRDHQRWSPICPFIRRIPVDNIPLDPDNPLIVPLLTGEHHGFDTCGPYTDQTCPCVALNSSEQIYGVTRSLERLGIYESRGPAYPNFITVEARMRSYANWPLSIKQRPDELSEAGFYYTGRGDETVCFHCGGGVKDWIETDDPWVEHAFWFSKCTYVILTKGAKFIENVRGQNNKAFVATARELQIPSAFKDKLDIRDSVAVPSTSSLYISPPARQSVDDGRMCKICFQEDLGVVFLPCGHVVACVKCASSLNTCAVCRQSFTATIRIFIS